MMRYLAERYSFPERSTGDCHEHRLEQSVSANRTFFEEVTDVICLILSGADVPHADTLAVSRQLCRRIKAQFGGSTIYLPTNRSKAGGHASKLGMELLDLVEDEVCHQLRQAGLLDELERAAAADDIRQELLTRCRSLCIYVPSGQSDAALARALQAHSHLQNNKSRSEIATMLNVSTQAVCKMIRRAERHLQATKNPKGGERHKEGAA
ncbi:hypothetical protein [Stenotrophomonas maltophilia]|nr:hypothetical protein [Stenotrophomonas maltophilia]MBH1780470.1 hypothetical protein [Stenotrophomonas maltophilia]MDG2506641.1 hypothetical protein [Stenotrophomonas maltophilia]